MKKLIAVLIIITMTFPMYALDLIIMKNGDTYLGTILSMDVNDKVVIKLQEGTIENLKFKDINSFKKIETETATPSTATPNIVIQNTNTNENIIGSTVVKPLSTAPKEIITFIASTKKTPTKCVFQGVEYPIRNLSEFRIFYDAINNQYPNLDREVRLMFDDFIVTQESFLSSRVKYVKTVGTLSLVGGGVSSIVGLTTNNLEDGYLLCGIGLMIFGLLLINPIAQTWNESAISPEITSKIDEPIKNIVGKFNFIYAK